MTIEERLRDSLERSTDALPPWALSPEAVVHDARSARRRRTVGTLTGVAAVVVAALIATTVITRPAAVGPSPLPANPTTPGPTVSGTPSPSPTPTSAPSSGASEPNTTGFALLKGNRIVPAGGGPAIMIPVKPGETVLGVSRAAGGWLVGVGTNEFNVTRWLADTARTLVDFPVTLTGAMTYSVQPGGRLIAILDGVELSTFRLPSLEPVHRVDMEDEPLSGGESSLVDMVDNHAYYRSFPLGDSTGGGVAFVYDFATADKWVHSGGPASVSRDGSSVLDLRAGAGGNNCFGVRTRSVTGPTVCPVGRSVMGVSFAVDSEWIAVTVPGPTLLWYRTADVLAGEAEPQSSTGVATNDGLHVHGSRDGDLLVSDGYQGAVYSCAPLRNCEHLPVLASEMIFDHTRV